jgi:hypothetical protein
MSVAVGRRLGSVAVLVSVTRSVIVAAAVATGVLVLVVMLVGVVVVMFVTVVVLVVVFVTVVVPVAIAVASANSFDGHTLVDRNPEGHRPDDHQRHQPDPAAENERLEAVDDEQGHSLARDLAGAEPPHAGYERQGRARGDRENLFEVVGVLVVVVIVIVSHDRTSAGHEAVSWQS